MNEIDFLSDLHTRTRRDYLARVTEFNKADASRVARQFGYEYWDGPRHYGYGGYHYDGRWRIVANRLIQHYHLQPGNKILDVGCGKAFLLHDLAQALPGLEIAGLDISDYALTHAKKEARPFLTQGSATKLPYADASFDLVISITTLHNLPCDQLDLALREMNRVSKKHKYLCVESYRNDQEKVNLLYWQLTCESFYTPAQWQWWFNHTGYDGDYSFIYFE
jgi:protein-L-isoaspartate(D-aspartate) O-methyltransferase